MLILSIETSCDETSVSILKADLPKESADLKLKFFPIEILSNVVSSQVKIHAKWGGVVPNLAAREHLKNIVPVLESALTEAAIKLQNIDLFAVTKGHGLIPALLIGTNAAKTLSYIYKKPLIGIHHVEGHIYANFANNILYALPLWERSPTLQSFGDGAGTKGVLSSKNSLKNPSNAPLQRGKFSFPILNLVVSGGHTQLILMRSHLDYEVIGQTQDDAAGEAFDKVAKILDLGYPGGPIVSKRAEEFKNKINKIKDSELKKELESINFPRPMLSKDNFDFSFSGLKTAVMYFYKKLHATGRGGIYSAPTIWQDAICYEFQNAAVDVLVKKTIKAAKKYNPKTILISGGVAANKELRTQLEAATKEFNHDILFSCPPIELCGDNAAMIATAAFYRYINMQNKSQLFDNWRNLEADSNLKLT